MTPLAKLAATIVLGMSANTDNLSIGFAYGLRRVRISITSNMLIAMLTTAATLLALAAGRNVRDLMPPAIPDKVAGVMLISLGLANFWVDRRKRRRQAEMPTRARAGGTTISLRETLILACPLSLNNIGLAFAGGVADLRYTDVGLSVALFSVAFLWLGEWLSRELAGRLLGPTPRLPLDGNILIVGVGALVMMGL